MAGLENGIWWTHLKYLEGRKLFETEYWDSSGKNTLAAKVEMAREPHCGPLVGTWNPSSAMWSCTLYLKQINNLQSLKHNHGESTKKCTTEFNLIKSHHLNWLNVLPIWLFFRTMCNMYSFPWRMAYLYPLQILSIIFGRFWFLG